MKPIKLTVKHTIALLVGVVILVFLGTYASITIGGARTKSPGQTDATKQLLVFENKVVDSESDPTLRSEQELHRPGHYDFWFATEQDQPAEIIFVEQACKCSHVEICSVPKEWKELPPDQRAERLEQEKPKWVKLEKSGPLFKHDAGKAGVVRLNWTGEQAGPQRLWVQLQPATAQRVLAEPVRLEIALTFFLPLRVMMEGLDPESQAPPNELDVGTLVAGDTRKVNMLVVSPTRGQFQLTPRPPEDPCVTAGAATPLTDKELADLSSKYEYKFRSGYRVPVTVRERTPDGSRQLDLGLFNRWVRWDVDGLAEPLAVRVHGKVIGEVTFKDPEEGRDFIHLGSFPSAQGISKTMTVATDLSDLDVEIESYPEEFLDRPKLTPENTKVGRAWLLEVTVPPNRLDGPVPRNSAVVLKLKGSPRKIRIPIVGNGFTR